MPILFFGGIASMSKKHTGAAFKLVDGLGVLFSLHPQYQSATKDWFRRHHQWEYDLSQTEVMSDSGAFTAWNAGEPPLKALGLARLCERMARWCEGKFKATWFINLDVMPGRDASPEEIAEAIRQSDRNYAELIRALPGRILPVFHRGESPERLNEVQDMSPGYLCLSPIVRILEKRRIGWSFNVAAHLKDRNPKIQLHGLATTGNEIMRAVNWRSVDSTTWIKNAGRWGMIFVEHDDGIQRIPIGQRKSRNHFDHQDARLRARVVQLAAELGLGLDELRDDPAARHLFNLAEWSKRGHKIKRRE
jgi:hypothetical protein